MTCESVERELVSFQFGLVSDAVRENVEVHLRSCRECLCAYLELKRAIETAADVEPTSHTARARLRRAVAEELGVECGSQQQLKRRRWERPLAMAIAAVAVFGAGTTTRLLTAGPGSPPHAMAARRAPH